MSAEEFYSEDSFSESEDEEMDYDWNAFDTTVSYESDSDGIHCNLYEFEIKGRKGRYRTDKIVSQIPTKIVKISKIEQFCQRFPEISKKFFNILDNGSLTDCKRASGEIAIILENERFIWIRKLSEFNGHYVKFRNSWIEAINKTPVKIVKKLALTVQHFFTRYGGWQAVDKKQLAPLHIAAAMGDFQLCKYLLEKTTRKNPCGSKGLITLSTFGFDNYRYLIMNKQKEKTDISIGSYRSTPLHMAVAIGHTKICKLFMEHLDDKNPPIGSNITALHMAATNNQLQTYKTIMENVQDKNPKDKNGRTPLHIAANKGHFEVCELIVQNVVEKNPKDNVDKYHKGKTPFHDAAWHGNWKICKLFIENVDDKNPTDKFGDTPLHSVATMGVWGSPGHLKTAEIIIENIINKSPRNNIGQTPMHKAVASGYFAMCKLFINNIEDKNPADQDGRTPLHIAASNNHLKITKLIFRNAEDKNPRCIFGDTPLHKAAERGHFKVARFLAMNLRDLEPENEEGETPEELAHEEGHYNKLQTLKLSLFP